MNASVAFKSLLMFCLFVSLKNQYAKLYIELYFANIL